MTIFKQFSALDLYILLRGKDVEANDIFAYTFAQYYFKKWISIEAYWQQTHPNDPAILYYFVEIAETCPDISTLGEWDKMCIGAVVHKAGDNKTLTSVIAQVMQNFQFEEQLVQFVITHCAWKNYVGCNFIQQIWGSYSFRNKKIPEYNHLSLELNKIKYSVKNYTNYYDFYMELNRKIIEDGIILFALKCTKEAAKSLDGINQLITQVYDFFIAIDNMFRRAVHSSPWLMLESKLTLNNMFIRGNRQAVSPTITATLKDEKLL